MEMPSETEIVPNSSGYPPAAWTPFFTALASRSSDRLHGVISFHDDATPICGFAKSSSPMPTARNIPRAAVFSRPSVTSRLRGLISGASLGMPGCYARRVRRPTRCLPVPLLNPARAHHHHVGQPPHQFMPGRAVVEGSPDAAVTRAEVQPGLVVVVGRHRVAHDSNEEAVGQPLALLGTERLPRLPSVPGPPDARGSTGRIAAVSTLKREGVDRVGRVRVDHDGEPEVGREPVGDRDPGAAF